MTAYEILDLPPTATNSQIKAAYRRLARQYHPDRNPEVDTNAQIQLINQAYEILSDPEKKMAYDAELYAQFTQEVVDPQQAYREEFKRRRRERDKREKEEAERELRSVHRTSRYYALALCIIPLLIILDYYLPHTEVIEPALAGWQKTYHGKHSSVVVSYMQTPSGVIVVPHFLHIDYDYSAQPPIHFAVTRLFKKRISAARPIKEGFVVYEMRTGIYATGLLMPLIMLVVNLAYFLNYKYARWKLIMIALPVAILLLFIVSVFG